MPPAVNQEINVNINALVKRIQDVKEFVAVLKSLRSQSGPVVIDEKISKNAKASAADVSQLSASIDHLNASISQIDDKQPTRLSNAIKLLSSVVQGLAAAGQAVDFVKSWIPGFAAVKEKGSEAFGTVKEKIGIFALAARDAGGGAIQALRAGASSLVSSFTELAGGTVEAVAGLGAVGVTAGVVTGGVLLLVAAVAALVLGVAALLAGIGTLTAGLISLGTLGLLPLLEFGAKYNAQLEQGKLGIASIIASLAEFKDAAGQKIEGPEALNQSLILADDQIKKLKVDAINTIATFEEILPAFQSALGPGLAAGLQLDEIRKITVQIVQAAGAIGLPANQIAQEVRAILSGTINEDARLAKILGISNEMVKKWKEQGTLAEELNKRLAAFSSAGILAAQTLDGLTSNLQEAVNVFAGQATERAFEKLKERIGAILNQIFDFKKAGLNDSFAALSSLIDDIFVRAIDIAGDFIEEVIAGMKSIGEWLQNNRESVTEILSRVGRIVSVIAGIVLELAKVAGRLLTNQGIVLLINRSLSFTEALITGIGFVVLGLAKAFAIVAAYVSDTLNPILTITMGIALAIGRALGFIKLRDIATGGVGSNVAGAGATTSLPSFTVPKTAGAGGKKGGGGAHKPADVSDSEFALRRTRAEQEFNLEKDLLDRLEKLNEDAFQKRKISIDAFYNHQAELRNEQILAETRHIKALVLIQRDQARAELRKIAGDKDQTPQQKQAAQQTVLNKYLADAAEIEEKIAILKRDQADIAGDITAHAKTDTAELLKQFDGIVDEIDALNGHTAKLEISQILERLNPILEDLKRNFGEASLEARILQEYIDALVNQAQLRELDQRLQIPQQQSQLEILQVETQLEKKLITRKQAHAEINTIQRKYLEAQLQILKNELALADSARDQLAIKLRIAETENQLAKIQEDVDETARSINSSLSFAFNDFFASLADGTKSITEAFADLGTFILQMFARLAAAKLVTSIFGNLLGDEEGDGGIGGFLSGIFGGKKAAGDVVNARPGGRLIQVAEAGYDELVVSTDPRYAVRTSALLGAFMQRTGIVPNFARFGAGGFARSVADSFATIPRLAAGAFIPAAPTFAGAGAGGGDRYLHIKQVNVYDPAHVHDAMRSEGGEEVFWNFVDRNATAIRRRLKL